MDDSPLNNVLPAPDLVWMESDEYRKDVLHGVCLSIAFIGARNEDKVNVYANQLLSLGYMEYSDAIREGDGLRVQELIPSFQAVGQSWNYLTPVIHFMLKVKLI